MSFFLGWLLFLIALMLFLHLATNFIRKVRREAYAQGREEGYNLGRREVDNWWCGIDSDPLTTSTHRVSGRDPARTERGDARIYLCPSCAALIPDMGEHARAEMLLSIIVGEWECPGAEQKCGQVEDKKS